MRDDVEPHPPSSPPVEPHGRPSGRFGGRWLYLLPLALLLGAGWTFRDSRPTGLIGSDSQEVLDANGFPLESATDPQDPRRFRRVDGFVEDAATGIRIPDQSGLSPAEVFEQAGLAQPPPFGFDAGVGPDGPSAAQTPLDETTSTRVQASRPLGPPADLRYGIGPRPSNLEVEVIGVQSAVVPIGLDLNRALQVPRRADIVGWWSGGSVPGEVGPTVLVGHFDSRVSGGVFARLKDVTVGELINVTQSDGSRYVYFVTEVEHLSKTAFPTSKVYGRTTQSTLRLVTCGGKFDRKTGHYVDNTIVYADLWSSTPSPWATTTSPTFLEEQPTSSLPTDETVPSSQPVTTSGGLSSSLSTLPTRSVPAPQTKVELPPLSPAPSLPSSLVPGSVAPSSVAPSTQAPSTAVPSSAVASTAPPGAAPPEPAPGTTLQPGESVATTQPALASAESSSTS